MPVYVSNSERTVYQRNAAAENTNSLLSRFFKKKVILIRSHRKISKCFVKINHTLEKDSNRQLDPRIKTRIKGLIIPISSLGQPRPLVIIQIHHLKLFHLNCY